MLGSYGLWAAARNGTGALPLSFRNSAWTNLQPWKDKARATVSDLLLSPRNLRTSDVQVHSTSVQDGLRVEELSWQLPYGPRTEASFLKPEGARGRLPAILALHDHGGIKHFGKRKIVRAAHASHPLMERHRADYYGGLGWADEIARRGLAVLVHDVFPFESRRILAGDLPGYVVDRLMSSPQEVRELTPEDLAGDGRGGERCDVPAGEPENRIATYNAFAGQHESVVAKSLLCAGLTWPGVMVAEDRAALD